MSKPEATATAEYHLHQYHWLHAKDLLRLRDERAGAEGALDCAALLLIAFAVEAHANRLLEVGYPNEYRDERKFFSCDPFRGTTGKLCFLAEKLSVQASRGTRPLQTVCSLFDWRDAMVHARIERLTLSQRYSDPTQVQPPESKLLGYPATAGAQAMSDAEQFCDSLQAAAYAADWKDILSAKAFTGFLGLRGVSL